MSSTLTVTDGTTTIGYLHEKNGRLEAWTVDGRHAGSFKLTQRREAVRALGEATKQREATQ